MNRNVVGVMLAVVTFAVGVGVVIFNHRSFVHPTDQVLTDNLYAHQAEFQFLAQMANEDSHVQIVGPTFVGLHADVDSPDLTFVHEDVPWPRSESELRFTQRRWDQYRSLFKTLKLENGMHRKRDWREATFFQASVDFTTSDEGHITEKGYVYSSKPIDDSLTGSLDDIKVNRPALFFKKLNDNWYLYYEYSIRPTE
jgi:hypothetical protein